jgi:hypothetical protein
MHNYQLVRVAFPKSIRGSKAGVPHPKYGEIVEMGVGTTKAYGAREGDLSKFKPAIGAMGLVMKEDFDARNFAPYGLLDRDMPHNAGAEVSAVAELAAEKVNLQSERDALKAEIEALTKKAKGRKKATSEPEESGMVTTKKQQGTDDSGTN